MPAFDKVPAGQPWALPHGVYNELLDMLVWYRAQIGGNKAGVGGQRRDLDLVPVKNNSGAARDAFAVLGVDAPIFLPSDNLDEFKFRFALKGVMPAEASHQGKFAILLEPAPASSIVLAALSGLVPVKVNFGDAGDAFADVYDGDATRLKSNPETGAVQIVWKESGTGDKWALVRFGGGGGAGTLILPGNLNEDLASADAEVDVLIDGEVIEDVLNPLCLAGESGDYCEVIKRGDEYSLLNSKHYVCEETEE